MCLVHGSKEDASIHNQPVEQISVDVERVAGASEPIVKTLSRDEHFKVSLVDGPEWRRRLRTGRTDVAVVPASAAVVASGRSDLPNQINNVLAFPGVFRGLLDARATEITDGMLVAAAEALAGVVKDDELNANYIIPSVFDHQVTTAVAHAVAEQARHEPGATAEVRDTLA